MGLLPMIDRYVWGWSWGGWPWLAGVGIVILLGVFLLPWFFFLLNLHTLLNRVSPVNRAMPAAHVWLNFIPVFNLGWFLYTVVKVRDSVRAEYRSRGWPVEGDLGYNVGLATGVLAIVTFIMGWVPLLGWALGIAQLVCWIIYWLRTHELKNQLEMSAFRTPGIYPPPPPSWPTRPGSGPGSYGGARATAAGFGSGGTSPSDLRCGACGTPFSPSDRFCRACGLPLPQKKDDVKKDDEGVATQEQGSAE
jgi:hypothetical protein